MVSPTVVDPYVAVFGETKAVNSGAESSTFNHAVEDMEALIENFHCGLAE